MAECLGELAIVVDLAVERDPNGLVFVCERLGAPLNVDDAEAPMAETDAAVAVQARAIWSPVSEGVAHANHPVGIDRAVSLTVGNSADAAHGKVVVGNGGYCESRAMAQRRPPPRSSPLMARMLRGPVSR